MKKLNLFLILPLIAGFCLTRTLQAHTPWDVATFAGGCFWCMTPPFEELKGVVKVVAGYADGHGTDPNYDDYAGEGFTEAVQVTYDPTQITYTELVNVFWRQINPTDPGGQFVDRGPQYRAAIYYTNPIQKKLAQRSKEALARSGRYDQPIVTRIQPFTNFYPAEAYHQDFYKKDPVHYNLYHSLSGRDQYLNAIWGKKRK